MAHAKIFLGSVEAYHNGGSLCERKVFQGKDVKSLSSPRQRLGATYPL